MLDPHKKGGGMGAFLYRDNPKGYLIAEKKRGGMVALLCFVLLCFALLCFALLCFALLCFALLCFALLCFAFIAMR
jgi:hypothetical protein